MVTEEKEGRLKGDTERSENCFVGLTEAEAMESARLNGSNSFSERKRRGFLGRFIRAFGDPIIRILLCALALTLLLPGDGGGGLDLFAVVQLRPGDGIFCRGHVYGHPAPGRDGGKAAAAHPGGIVHPGLYSDPGP